MKIYTRKRDRQPTPKQILRFVRRFFRSSADPRRSDYRRRPKRVIYDIIPPNLELISKELLGIKKYPNRASRIFGYGWRAVFCIFLIIYLLTGIRPAEFLKKSVTALIGEPEQAINLYSTNCEPADTADLGGWQNPELASGEPSIKADNSASSYNEENSAVYHGGQASLVCSGFVASKEAPAAAVKAPEPASTTEPTLPGLVADLATTSVETTETTADIIAAAETIASSSLDLSTETLNTATGTAPVDESQVIELPAENIEVGAPQVIELAPNPSTAPDAAPTAEGVEGAVVNQSQGLLEIIQEVISAGEAQLLVAYDRLKASASAEGSVAIQPEKLGQFVSAKINFSLAQIASSSVTTDAASETDQPPLDEQSGSSSLAAASTTGDRIIFWYSTDSATGTVTGSESWTELATLPFPGELHCAGITSAGECFKQTINRIANGGYFTFAAPLIKSWQDADNLKIKLEGKSAGQTTAIFYLDSAWLTVDFEPGENDGDDHADGYDPAATMMLDNQEISFNYTDNNDAENILIETDGKEYGGITGALVYFRLVNLVDGPERINLQIHFPGEAGRVETIERLTDNGWNKEGARAEPLPEQSLLKKALGKEIKKKPVPEFLSRKTSTRGQGALIGAGKAQYYKMRISYPAGSNGEFYIEAVGDDRGYGLLDPWWNSAWKYKLPLTVDNRSNSATSTDYQLLVEISSTTADFWNHVNADGSDVRFVNSSETTQLNFWTQYWDRSASSTQIWVEADSLPAAATSTIYLYYGNSAASSTSDMYSTFSYSAMQDLYYVVTSSLTGATIYVVSLVDNNQVQLDSQTAVDLNKQGITTFATPTTTSVLRAKGPVMAYVGNVQDTDAMVPLSFAGTQFAMPSIAGNPEYFSRYAPYVNASVSTYDANTLRNTSTVNAGTAGTYSRNMTVAPRVVATEPILLYFWSASPGYSEVVYPASARDLYGIRSNNNYVGFVGNTDFSIYCSGGASVNVAGQTTAARYTNATCANGAEGAGNAVRLTAQTNPIGAIQQNDSDGLESTVFLPDIELATEYMVPTNAQYIAIACPPKFATNTLSLYGPTNSFIASTTCTVTATNPGKAYFGSITDGNNLAAGSRVVSDLGKPFYAYFEDSTKPGSTGGDEGNLWGAVQARKRSYVEPTVSLGAEEIFTVTVSGKVYSDEGVNALLTRPVIGLAVGNTLIATTTASITDGSFVFTNVPPPAAGSSTVVFIASSTISGASYNRYAGINDIANYDIYLNRLIVRHDDAGPITNVDLDQYDTDQNSQIKARVASGALTASSSQMLYLWPGATYRPGGVVTLPPGSVSSSIGGDLKIASSTSVFNAETNAVSIGGDWLNLGSFIKAGGQTTTFTATSSGYLISSGSSTFEHLVFNGAGGGWSFASSTILDGNLTLTAGALTGTTSLEVRGGSISGNGSISFSGGQLTLSGSGDFGGNTGWTFNDLVFGNGAGQATTTKIGSGQITASSTLTIAADQNLYAGSGTWILTGPNTPLVINGYLVAQTSVFRYSAAGDVTPALATYYRLELAPGGAGSPTYTIPAGAISTDDYLYIGNGTNPVTVSAETNDAALDINGNFIIYPAAVFSAASSSEFTVAGNWTINGNFNHSGGTVTFDASATGRTINASSSAFHNIVFNNAAGGWTVSANATSTNDWILTAGTFTAAPAVTIEVGGLFANGLANASTTWTGTTLFLNGPAQTINSKANNGDTYNILRLGSNTQAAMWNSTSTVYTLAASSSLYSMDHNGVDGALYLWGEYYKPSGTDYWSWQTDFDGASLAGSERQANIRVASGSIIVYNGGGLELIGSSTAATTLANQGAGTFSLAINSGSINANYYQIRDIDAAGLNLVGGATVTDLDYGDFLLQTNGGSMITVGANTLDNNSNLTVTGGTFATSSGIAAGYNVTLTGSPGSYWLFTAATGNFAGEAFDNEAVGTCGRIRWDDSTCAETTQLHYRWRNDDGGETAASWKGAEDAPLTSQNKNENLRLRLGFLSSGGSAATNYNYRLQFADKTGFDACALVPSNNYNDVPTTTAANPAAVMAASTYFINLATTTRQLTATGTFVSGYLVESPSNQSSAYDLNPGESTEIEYAFQFSDDADASQSFCLRAVNRTIDLAYYDQIAEVKLTGPSVSGNVYADEGSTAWSGCDGSTKNISLAINGQVVASTSCAVGSGAYLFSDVTKAADDPLSVFLNQSGGNTDPGVAATKVFSSAADIINLAVRKNRVIVRTESGVAEITNADLAHCDSASPAACANVPYLVAGGDLTLEAAAKLIVNSGSTFRPAGQIDLTAGAAATDPGGDLLIELGAVLNPEDNDLAVGGDWTNLGSFSVAVGQTVTFTATATGFLIDPGASNFETVVLSGAGGGWSFTAAATLNGDLNPQAGTLSGSVDITVNGGNLVGNGTINLTGGTTTLAGSGNFGSNNDWTFAALVFGDGLTSDNTAKIGNGNISASSELIIAANHSLDAYQNTWTLSGGGTPFVIAGSFSAASSTFNFSSNADSAIPAVVFYRLYLAPAAAGSPVYTIASGTLATVDWLTIGDGLNPVVVTAGANDAILDLNGKLLIATSSEMIAAASSSFTVADDWQNNGTFTANGGSVIFDASSTGKTISAGGSSFYNIIFDNVDGGWTIIDNASSTNDWQLIAAAAFTATSSIMIEVRGVFTNGLGSASTTWAASSTLFLNSASSSAINTKTAGADHYDTLKIGASTDIRLWNSVAETYDIDSSGSLYSMNHGQVAGHLYLWGDYHLASGTEYWNDSIDYDGTSLAGAERQSITYVAASSTITVDGGTLQLSGSSTVSASVVNQGGGLYNFNVSAGALNARYYRIRNTAAAGLNFSGSPSITSLDYGDYELGVEGGSLITVTPTVLAANPSKIISGDIFATSTGITTGFNVTLAEAADYDWTFVSFSGNLSGEDFDYDPADPDGNIVWSNLWDAGWRYVLPITIDNTANASSLTEYQVLVEIASSTNDFWRHVAADGADIAFVNSDKTASLNFWLQYWDKSASSTQIWVQVDYLPAAATSTIYLYYGNSAAASTSDMYSTFSYSALQDLYYVVTSNLAGASVRVVSLIDNNTVQLDNQTAVNLNRQATTSFGTVANTSVLRAKGPVMAKITGIANADALVPISFAGTAFVVPQITGTESFGRYAPYAGATTTIYDGNTVDNTSFIAVNNAATIANNITVTGRLLSTNPILFSQWSSSPGYSIVPYPVTLRDLYGIRSNNNYVGFTGNTDFTIYCSSGGTINVAGQTTAARYTNATCANGAEGAGNAVRLTAQTNPIGSIQLNDSDGAEATSFMPDVELAAEYMIPTNSQYIAIACPPKFGTNVIEAYGPTGSFITSATCVPGASTPGKAYFGSATDGANLFEATRIISTTGKSFYAYYEDASVSDGATAGDEGNLWGTVQARKRAFAEPNYSLGAEISSDYVVSGAVYSDEGINPLLSSPVIGLAVAGILVATTTASPVDGSFQFIDLPKQGASIIHTVFIASSTLSGVAYDRYAGSGNIADLDIYQDRVIARHDDAGPITNADLDQYDTDQDLQIKARVASGALTASSSQMLYLWPGTEFRPGGSVTLPPGSASSSSGGDLKIASSTATFNPESNAVSVGGDWTNLGTFTAAGGEEVTFTATATGFLINPGTSDFQTVVFDGAGGGWSFTADVVLQGDLNPQAGTLSGSSNITVMGGNLVGNGTVNLTGGTVLLSGSGNFGSNTDWTFTSLIFGDGLAAASTTKIGSGDITVGGIMTVDNFQSLDASNNLWIISGNGTPLVLSGTLAAASSTFSFTSNLNTNVIPAAYHRLELAPAAAGSPTYIMLGGTLVVAENFYIGNGTNPVTVTANSNNPILDIAGDLIIRSGGSLVAPPTAAFTIAGSWANSGAFTANGGRVTFDADSGGRTINAGNSPFYNIEFNNAAGDWTVAANASSTSDWEIVAAAHFTATSSITIEVQGVFTNALGSASTTWAAGSTLYLNGTSQTLNTKTGPADHYDTLKIGANTDVAMWNSLAEVYDVNPSGSLYSMDHGQVDGHLYLWGDYQLATGTANWSYGTDYDGTSLTGSERQSITYVASGSAITIAGGTLNFSGSSTATSTITNQGGGRYGLNVSSGTFNGWHYQIRNTDAAGLNLTGSPIIASLDYGDYQLPAASGNLITVAPSVLAANPDKTITACSFATSTDSTTAYNVYLTGASAAYWNFTGHSGGFDGENFDFDPGDPRGYLVWDDSPTYQPRSQRWRWYHDQENETPTSSAAAEITAPQEIPIGNRLKLRLSIAATNGLIGYNVKIRLQYSPWSDFSADVNYVGEPGSTTALWTYADGVDFDNAAITTNVLTDADALATHNESGVSSSNYTHAANAVAEWEFTLLNQAAVSGTTYYFRAYDDQPKIGAVQINVGESYPSIVAGASSMTSAVLGVSQGTAVEGITADISTNAGSIPFGVITLGQQLEGVQQLAVSTNGEGGYQLLVYERQNLMNGHGAIINPLAATNDNPQAWPVNPDPAAFGYHSGDETLSGLAPSRFAPNDSYAKLENTMKEVGYSATPVQNETLNLVYKLEVTALTQSPGEYQNELVYIMVPTY